MKHSISYLFTLLAVSLLLLSCKSKNDPNIPPVEWQVAENINPLLTMTLTMGYPSDFEATADMEDKVAVFRDGICVGIASPEETSLGMRFFVMIYDVDTDKTLPAQLTVRFYSNSRKHLYHASESLIFASDTQVGSVSDPQIFTWIQD